MPAYKNEKYLKLVNYVKSEQQTFYRLAYSYVKERESAQDIVQTAIYKALTSVDKLKSPEFMKTWMYRIIINSSISYLRKNKKVVVLEDFSHIPSTENISVDDKLDLYEAIDSLNENYKTVIILRYFEELKLEEISAILNCNINTVKTRLYTALNKLKVEMEGEV